MLPNQTYYRSLMPSIAYEKHTSSRISCSHSLYVSLLSDYPTLLHVSASLAQDKTAHSRRICFHVLVGAHSFLLLSDSRSRLLSNPFSSLDLSHPRLVRHRQAGCESSSCCGQGAILGAILGAGDSCASPSIHKSLYSV